MAPLSWVLPCVGLVPTRPEVTWSVAGAVRSDCADYLGVSTVSVPVPASGGVVVAGDNLPVLRQLPDGCCQVVYLDPPFNTGRTQERRRTRTVRDADGGLSVVELSRMAYRDAFEDYTGFLVPRLVEVRRVLAESGTVYVHVDPRESAYVRIMLDTVFGRDAFVNEIVWAYNWGGRPRSRWPAKHDTILMYARCPAERFFSFDEVDRLPYKAPSWQTPERVARGQTPTDVWDIPVIVGGARERTGYPTQKPVALLRRIVAASSRPGDLVADFFAGSGTAGVAAVELGRRFLLVDENPEAVQVMRRRFAGGVSFVE